MAEEHDTVRGLVLAGGGAKGSYQVGVYQALMELGWLPDVITGASVGSLNAALFVMGKVNEAADLWRSLDNHGVLELPEGKTPEEAKNYLKENELKILNNLVSGYFDFAEIMAMEHRPVYMMDYVKQLDTILQSTGRPLLKGSGSISHEEAMDKAIAEYRKYQIKVLTPVEEAYLESINALGKIAKRKGRQSGENH